MSKNKTLALKISFLFLFIIWGLQYEMVNDWPGNLQRWKDITSVLSSEVTEGGNNSKVIEPNYVYLVRLFQDFGFYGWLIICAIFELCILYILTRKYVAPRYYWLTIFILMLRIDYGLLFINSNRQTLAVFISMISMLVLMYNKFSKNSSLYKFQEFIKCVAVVLIIKYAAGIHTSAYMTLVIIPIYFITKYVNKISTPLILLFNALFLMRYIIDPSIFKIYTLNLFGELGFQDYYSVYLEGDGIATNNNIYTDILYLLIMNTTLIYYKNLSHPIKVMGIMVILSIILGAFLSGNLFRINQYLYVYMIFLVPYIVDFWKTIKWNSFLPQKKIIAALMILFCLYSFEMQLRDKYYYKWKDFKTILFVPWK